jgi:hypothetical protein
MSGWIKVHRQLTNHWIWDKPEYLKWWIDILMQSNIESKKVLIKGQLIQVNRGEVIYSYDTWANRWKINKSKVVRFLKMLEKDLMIELKNETVTTRLIVCKYDTYQGERNDSETQVIRRRNSSETQVKPTKEVKELKNIISTSEESHNEIFRKLWTSTIWLEGIAMKNKASIEQVRNHLNEFRQEQLLKAELKVSEEDAKKHFVNWIKRGNPIPEIEANKYNKSTLIDNWW